MVVTVFPTDNKLTARQLQAVPLLARGSTAAATAKSIGVSAKTLQRWKAQPFFISCVKKAEQQLYDEALASIKRLVPSALACLVRNMSEDVSPYVQVSASSKILDLAVELGKVAAIEQDYQELRQVLKSRGIAL